MDSPKDIVPENVNPARAGMIRPQTDRKSPLRCKPRASGDDPALIFDADFCEW